MIFLILYTFCFIQQRTEQNDTNIISVLCKSSCSIDITTTGNRKMILILNRFTSPEDTSWNVTKKKKEENLDDKFSCKESKWDTEEVRCDVRRLMKVPLPLFGSIILECGAKSTYRYNTGLPIRSDCLISIDVKGSFIPDQSDVREIVIYDKHKKKIIASNWTWDQVRGIVGLKIGPGVCGVVLECYTQFENQTFSPIGLLLYRVGTRWYYAGAQALT